MAKQSINIDVIKPPVKLLVKLAKIVVLAEETDDLPGLPDPDVQAWIEGMRKLRLIE